MNRRNKRSHSIYYLAVHFTVGINMYKLYCCFVWFRVIGWLVDILKECFQTGQSSQARSVTTNIYSISVTFIHIWILTGTTNGIQKYKKKLHLKGWLFIYSCPSAAPVNNFIHTSFCLNLAGFQSKFDHKTIIVLKCIKSDILCLEPHKVLLYL